MSRPPSTPRRNPRPYTPRSPRGPRGVPPPGVAGGCLLIFAVILAGISLLLVL